MRLDCDLQKVMNSCLRARCVEIPADDERRCEMRWVNELFKFNDEWRHNGSRRAIDWWNYEWCFAGVEFEVKAFKSREVVIYFRLFYILVMDDCDAAPPCRWRSRDVGGWCGDEAIWNKAVCDAARSVWSLSKSRSRQRCPELHRIGCPE